MGLHEEMINAAYSSSKNHHQQLKGPVQIKGIVKEACHNDGENDKYTNRINRLDLVERNTSRTSTSQQITGHEENDDDDDEDSPPPLV